ncbi:ABC transporter ATP-binding protein [Sulfitobacter sp. TSTF-M16]|uniref:ABC transporter ATP-binding protein n=1 Tax=Sulfitobacter aestuariivivens TaxID=2766981 RepID=A0A927HEE8_9RHOB|nr:ABC transporter ATP-binding protein [Sulfitobacter aestuariivivens]MBD3664702.1 ABC transporter ATP-binding protein [Sulfitobacter aestuariivivens]
MRTMPQSVYRYIFRNSKWAQVVVIILTLCLLPLAPVPLELQRRLLDDAVANGDVDLLIWLATLYVIALLAASGLKLGMRIQRELISAKIVHALRRSVYYHIYTVTPPALLKASSKGEDVVDEGAVVSMLSSETEKLGGFAGAAISGPLLQIGTLCVVLGYMFYIEPLVASIALALYSPQFIIVPLFQARLNRLAGEKAITVRELGNFIVDNAEPDLLDKPPPTGFTLLTDRILQIRTRFLMTKNIMKTLNNLLIALGPFGVIAWGGYLVIQGEVEVGVILAFVSGLERLGGPIRELIGSYAAITDARMRYRILLESFPEGIDPEEPEPMPKLSMGVGGKA